MVMNKKQISAQGIQEFFHELANHSSESKIIEIWCSKFDKGNLQQNLCLKRKENSPCTLSPQKLFKSMDARWRELWNLANRTQVSENQVLEITC